MLGKRRVTRSMPVWLKDMWFTLIKGETIEIQSYRGDKVHCIYNDSLVIVSFKYFMSCTTPMRIITMNEEEKRFRQLYLEQLQIGDEEGI